MAAEIIASGTVKAGGKVYRLAICSDMVRELQRRTGWKAKRVLRSLMAKDGDLRLMRLICHVALQRYHPGASIEVAGDIVTEDLAGLGAVIMACPGALPAPNGHQGHGPTLH